ncbi:uncharacterized protein IUM83_10601 [Phytophthora cinnamomi]|uniref:uncharacterized protein n=1 Tax=Phytophthora cinnamomi TaxID=4785 RepID=UPI00355A1B29|nr:hypothetical protein IUM83_10601 [Phytophthora cinnamomi]
MIDKKTPLRQIQFSDHGFTVVHHRRREFNRVTPPFIKEPQDKSKKNAESTQAPAKRAKSKPATDSVTPAETPVSTSGEPVSTPPAYDDQSDSSEYDSDYVMSEAAGSVGEPHSGDPSDSEAGTGDAMVDTEVTLKVRRKSIWPTGKAPKFPVGPTQASDLTSEYPVISSVNSYEWLATGEGSTIPPDYDIIIWDRSKEPATSVGSYVKASDTVEQIQNSSVYQGSVEELSLKDLCSVITEFLGTFDSNTDPDSVVSAVQAQPSLHRVLLDSASPGNFLSLRAKAFGHAVLRELSTQAADPGGEPTVSERLCRRFPDHPGLDLQEGMSLLFPDPPQFWLKMKLAEFDLALQIIAPSVYLDPFKMGALLGPLPKDLRETIDYLRDQATSVTPTVPTRL